MTPNVKAYERICEIAELAMEAAAPDREQFIRVTCSSDDTLRRQVTEHVRAICKNELTPLLAEPIAPTNIAADAGEQATIAHHAPAQRTEPFEPTTIQRDHGGQNKSVGDLSKARIGGFQILGTLGAGGMGVVYRAFDPRTQRQVAIKTIQMGLITNEKIRTRFEREAIASGKLSHPNIVKTFQFSTDGDVHFIVLDYVLGCSLQESGQQPLMVAATLAAKIARGVQHAHDNHVIHRDLKPPNVLLNEENEPFITDFGLAHLVDADAPLTRANDMLGTPVYMAPEQFHYDLDSPPGPAADVYGIGGILYFMLTGGPPFSGKTPAHIYQQVLNQAPPSPSTLREVPRDLEVICLQCLAKEPQRRYRSAGELADDLEAFLAGRPISARPVGAAERAWMWAKRHRAATLSLALIAIMVLAIPWIRTQFNQLDSQKTQAERQASEQTKTAEQSKKKAALATEEVRQERYFDLIQKSHQEMTAGNTSTARELLNQCNASDRHWEWRHLVSELDAISPLATTANVSAVEITRDGSWGIAATPGAIRVWDLDSRYETLAIKTKESPVALAVSSTHVLAAMFANTIACWDLLTGDELTRFSLTPYDASKLGSQPLHAKMFFHSDGERLVATRGGSVANWNWQEGNSVWRFTEMGRIVDIALAPDEGLFAVAGEEQGKDVVKLIEPRSGTFVETKSVADPILGTQFSSGRNGLALAVLHRDRIEFHDLNPPGQVSPAMQFAPYPREIKLASPLCFDGNSGNELAIGAENGVILMDGAARKVTHRYYGTAAKTIALGGGHRVIGLDAGKQPVVCQPSAAYRVPDVLGFQLGAFNGDLTRIVVSHSNLASALAIQAEQQHRLRHGVHGSIEMLDESNRVVPEIGHVSEQPGSSLQFGAVGISPSDETVALAKHTLTFWSLEGSEHRLVAEHELENGGWSMAYSQDGRRLAIASPQQLEIWDTETVAKETVAQPMVIPRPGLFAVAFSPDGALLAATRHASAFFQDAALQAASRAGERAQSAAEPVDGLASSLPIVEVYDLKTRREPHRLFALTLSDIPTNIEFSPDGRLLAAGLCNGVVRIWNTDSWSLVGDVPSGEHACLGLAFTKDSQRLFVAGTLGVGVWSLSPLKLVLALSMDADDVAPPTVAKIIPPFLMSNSGKHNREILTAKPIHWSGAGRSQLQMSADDNTLGFWSVSGRSFWHALPQAVGKVADEDPFTASLE